ncbi:MAG: tripartite tricarboxylate transporter substrate binding protein [Rhodospirillaceae bacterium]|nr:tripartite tricarboxylate transporter substrate binding protein [Rhodospirillaceae bacterium]
MSTTAYIRKTTGLVAIGLALSVAASGSWAAEKFPNRPIDIIANYGPGGGADQFVRALAPLLSRELGVKVQPSNVTGAQGNAGVHAVATAKPDGYTIGSITAFSVASWLQGYGKLRAKDMSFIGLGQVTDSMLFVPYKSKFKNFKEILAYVKANPGKMKLALGASFGGPDDLTLKYLATKGYKWKPIPYELPAERYAAPLGGHVDIMYEEPGDVRQFIDAKQIRPVVVFSPEKNPYYPDVPKITDFGFDMYLKNYRAIITAKDVPADRQKILSEALGRAFTSPEFKKFCDRTATCTAPRNPQDTRAFIENYYGTMKKYSKQFGIPTKE